MGASPARQDDSVLGAFIAWAACGLLWFFSYLGAFSVGGVILIPAVLLTVLLATKAMPTRWRPVVWVAFGAWVVWWLLVVAGPARVSADWMLGAGVGFLLLALGSLPGSLGLPFGAGVTAFFAGLGLETGTAMTWIGLAVAVAALVVWLMRRPRTLETTS